MNSSAKKSSKVSVNKKSPVVVRKAAVVKKAAAKSPVKTRRAPVTGAKKPVARRRPGTEAAKVRTGKRIESPMGHAIPLMVPSYGARPDAESRQKMNPTTVVLMAVCAAALIVVGSIAVGSSDRPAQRGPSKIQSFEPASSGKARSMLQGAVEPVAAVSPSVHSPSKPAVQVMPLRSIADASQDVGWAAGVIQERMNRIAGLYSIFRANGPALTGSLAAHLEVESDGHVGRAWLETDSINNAEFSQKVIRELITARFAPTGIAGPVGLIVPIGFGDAGTKLMAVAAHNVLMPGEAAVPASDTVAEVPAPDAQRNS